MLKVLVVEDEETMREIVIEKLLQLGIKSYTEAKSVSEAKLILESNDHFDLVISDYAMPGGHGGDLLRFVYEKKLPLKFVLFTSSMHLDLPATDHNFLGVVQKPDLKRLSTLIEQSALVKHS
ncbi:MAG: response regulator [Bacteriovorax sp.]